MSALSVQGEIQRIGRYELLSELGQGAMGVVYKARDPELDRVVAIKTINLSLPKEERSDYEARFYQEARAAGSLNHPNIVTIYDVGKSERVAYMAMELLEGEELRSILSGHEPLPLELALDIAAQVADGLAYAHDRHIVHRDIKPANIMIVRDGLVKITDFGIARMRSNEVKTMTGMIIGSPKYMSPEQVAGKRTDFRSDLFSLGVVLYEMLTGEAPFQADSIHGIMYQIMQYTPAPPSVKIRSLPEVVDLITAKALNKSVEHRYQNAEDMARDLRECRDMMAGKLSAPTQIAEDRKGTPPPPTTTRRSDATGAVKRAPAPPSPEEEAKGLILSKAFDSYEATLRLAAMTRAQKEKDAFATTEILPPADAAPTANARAGATDTWHDSALAPRKRRSAPEAKASYTYLWIVSGLAIAIAVVLFLLR